MDIRLDSVIFGAYVLLVILSFIFLSYKLWSWARKYEGTEQKVAVAVVEFKKDENDNIKLEGDGEEEEFDGSKYVDPLFLEYALARGMPKFDFDHPEV